MFYQPLKAQTELLEPRLPEQDAAELRLPERPGAQTNEQIQLLAEKVSRVWMRATNEDKPQTTVSVLMVGLSLNNDERVKRRLSSLLGQSLNNMQLDECLDWLLDYYEELGFPVVDLQVDAELLEKGHLDILVTEGCVGNVGLQKSRYFSDKHLAQGICLETGKVIQSGDLLEDIAWLSKNPFRKAGMSVAAGQKYGDVDILLTLNERRPYRFYTGVENTGSEQLGEWRWLLGGTWGNAFDLDHIVSYQFTRGDSLDRFFAHAFSWAVPIPSLQDTLRISASYAEAMSDQDFDTGVLENDGEVLQLNLAYDFVLQREKGFRWDALVALEYKSFDNLLLFGGDPISPSRNEIFQLRFSQAAQWDFGDTRLSLSGDLVFSPGGITSENSDDSFRALNSEAHSSYVYAKINASLSHRFSNDVQLQLKARGQIASTSLLASERQSLGGIRGIRGYRESDELVDEVVFLSSELYSPPLTMDFGKLRGVFFTEGAVGWSDGERIERGASGFGLRWTHRHVNMRADYGWNTDGSSRWNMGLAFSY